MYISKCEFLDYLEVSLQIILYRVKLRIELYKCIQFVDRFVGGC